MKGAVSPNPSHHPSLDLELITVPPFTVPWSTPGSCDKHLRDEALVAPGSPQFAQRPAWALFFMVRVPNGVVLFSYRTS
ncbi:hypothetical protein PoB_002888300 [Plakobranchus ocellatus]|uniref:Uncharacterized protein n=1 Tax=Plakobranchus ocellatus TaxID=259542 RepID=A0AAV4A5A1_9GAST|nr:hypothetical protein PoB_002888300 [Plakobranchus ocellatus]